MTRSGVGACYSVSHSLMASGASPRPRRTSSTYPMVSKSTRRSLRPEPVQPAQTRVRDGAAPVLRRRCGQRYHCSDREEYTLADTLDYAAHSLCLEKTASPFG